MKRQICFRLSESMIRFFEAVREKTGVPISQLIELKLKGFWIWNIEKSCWVGDLNE